LGAASASPSSATSTLGDFAAPVRNAAGAIIGVIAAKLSWRAGTRAATDPDSGRDPLAGQPLLLDRGGLVLAGPPSFLGRKWAGEAVLLDGDDSPGPPRFETLAEGRRYLITRAAVQIGEPAPRGGWLVQLAESTQRVYERADALAARIVWVSVCLGALTALAGALGAQRLTGRLQRLTRSVGDVRRHGDGALEVPAGDDEAAQLGVAFAGMLADLRQERSDLRALSSELERRVAVRSREVERLAEESRYAAVVRERLKIARDLHDTLAHSMMAMLSEIRILRRLEAHDPASLADELARAEQVALEGLNEARTAINQMRVNAVRDTGLGAALSKTLAAFGDETGLPVNFTTDADAARFGDERAETVYRMAGEALRNIARHARARRVEVSLLTGEGTRCELRIADDGVGFDPGARYEGHFGLIGLREQAELIGAALAIESSSERGTTLTIAWKTSPEEL
jgi:signal transduction histidine kinase